MKKKCLLVFVVFLCFCLISCNRYSNDMQEKDIAIGCIKTRELPYIINIRASQASYKKSDKIELLLYIGFNSRWLRMKTLEFDRYKVIFEVTDNIELIENNELLLEDFPSERWYFKDDFVSLLKDYPDPIVIEIDFDKLQAIERGVINVMIVGESVTLDEVNEGKIKIDRDRIDFVSTPDKVMFGGYSGIF